MFFVAHLMICRLVAVEANATDVAIKIGGAFNTPGSDRDDSDSYPAARDATEKDAREKEVPIKIGGAFNTPGSDRDDSDSNAYDREAFKKYAQPKVATKQHTGGEKPHPSMTTGGTPMSTADARSSSADEPMTTENAPIVQSKILTETHTSKAKPHPSTTTGTIPMPTLDAGLSNANEFVTDANTPMSNAHNTVHSTAALRLAPSGILDVAHNTVGSKAGLRLAPSGIFDFEVFSVSPREPESGWALLGEVHHKWVAVSPNRFIEISVR